MSAAPSLSVVVVTPNDFAQIRRTVRHLRAQDVVDDLELVLVAPSEAAVADHHTGELDAFAAVRTVALGRIPNVDRAAASGILAATADIVAVIEDHAFVQPGWARAVIAAYRDGPWVAVGSVMGNANPRSGLSWANLLLGYGWWIDPGQAGEMPDVPSHNGSYRRAAVAAFENELPDRMGRDGDLHDRLRAGGGRMYLAGEARITHANPSRLAPTADLRFHAGRLYGHSERTGPVGRSSSACCTPSPPRSSRSCGCAASAPSTSQLGVTTSNCPPASCPACCPRCSSTPPGKPPATCAGPGALSGSSPSSRWTGYSTSPRSTAGC